MAKLTKRLLIIAMAVLLVAGLGIAGLVMASEPEAAPVCFKQGDVNPDGAITAADAIYLLYASFPMFEDEYPLNQDCDFEDDGVIDRMDAIYLLYASNELTAADYPLKEMVHNYHEPVWSWDETAQTASVTLKCGCGQEKVLDADDGVSVSATVDKAATCTAAGTTTLNAKVTYENEEYAGTKTVTVPATGIHALDATPDCVTNAQCANCDYEWVAPGHSMKLVRTIEATCQAAGEERYECQNTGCSHFELVTLEQLPHTLQYMEGADHLVEGETCVYVKKYTCANANCTYAADGTAASDTYTKHDYSILEVQEATCVATGLKTYKCVCGDVKPADAEGKDIIPVNENHNWGDDGKCQNDGCAAAKVVATENKVAANDLTANTSLELKDKEGNAVALTMDQAALDTVTGGENAQREIQIQIDQVPVEDLDLEDAAKEEQIRGTVYDFSMAYTDGDKEKVTDFGGKVTVSVPYILAADETADDIDVWYVDDNGEIESVKGTYCNGYVTFTVEHFSYYTVTRLTAAERCQRYGHMPVHTVKEATCTEAGYDMIACQRCGEVTQNIVTQPEGHAYGDADEVAATCTQTGTRTLSCQNCIYKITSIIPAKGHDMKQDAQKSIAATCTKEGKTVKTCANEGCGHSTEEATAQLAHTYEKSENGSQKASCIAGGFDLYVCTREGCGDEIKKNETTPLGHSYPQEKAQWDWTEDEFGNWTAKVTLTCTNGCGQTQKLDAVVVHDTDASQNASCLGSGATVYDGTVFYNNVTYTDVKEITQVAPGHQPGTAWEFNDGRHYRICKVCQEMVEPTAHVWGEAKVTKEATCVDAGEQSVACSVCGYSKTTTVPATGIHDIVDGVCADCGFAEATCRHLRMHATEVDVSQYDVCPGLELTFYTCDCGENQYIEYNDHGCSFPNEWEDESTEDEYGFDISTHTATCTECGLKMVDKYYSVVDKELCTRAYVNSVELILNGQVLGAAEHYMHEVVHPGATLVQTVELTEESHGLCGETIEIKRCPCGAYTSASPVYHEEGTEGVCHWQWIRDEETGEYCDVCATCGAKRTEGYKLAEDSEPCLPMEECVYTYYVDGEEVYSCSYFGGYYMHDFQVEELEMLGDKCTDGMIVKMVCEQCGLVSEDFTNDHVAINEEVIDLSDADICCDRLIQAYCPCGEEYAEWHLDGDGRYCQWQWTYDYELDAEVSVCMICGTRRVEERTYGDKGEDCRCMLNAVTTFTDKDGNEFATALRREEATNHNMKYTYTLAEGAQSCEDGVIEKEYCTDCDYEWTHTNNYHNSYELASYDLSAFESCTDRVVLTGCACGENVWMNYEGSCNWQHVTGSEFSYTEKCAECGLIKKESWTNAQTDDPCEVRTVRLIEFSKEGVDSLKFSYDRIEQAHSEVYELALKEGSKTCSDGFTVTMTCTRCDYHQEYSGYAPVGEHPGYTISRELLSEGELCGTVYACTVSCACGEESWTNIQWEGDRCQYQGGTYSDEEEAWVYPCVICGGTRTDKTEEKQVEGTTCTYAIHEVDTYRDKDGNVLFTQEYNSENDRHTEVRTFRMNGTTCQEGYYVDVTCQKCDYTEQGEYMYTECRSWTTAEKTLFDHEDICGPVNLSTQRCPCGNVNYTHMNNYCPFNWYWDEQLQREAARCQRCGLKMVGGQFSENRPGTCLADVTLQYTFIMGEEEPVEVEEHFTRNEHTYVTSYSLNGQTCEDGWTASRSCYYCGNTEYWVDTYYDHEYNTVEYYDLSQYGACGGYVYRDSCACGQNTSHGSSTECSWEYTGNEDAEGLDERYCEKCGIYCYRGDIGQTNTEECTFEGVYRFKLVKDGEVKLNISVPFTDERHDWETTGVALENPGSTCEAGVILYMTCRNCGKSTTGSTHGHDTYVTRTIDLAQLGSSCGGYIYQQSCACGMRSTYHWDMNCDADHDYKSTGDNQNGTDTEIRTCHKCGLVFTEQRVWTTDPATCMKTITGSVTVLVNGVQDNLAISDTYTNHNYQNTNITLVEGAESCEDGILVTQTCSNCQHSYTSEENYHRTYVAQRLSLSNYGSVCGGELQKIACACGEHVRYNLAQDNTCRPEQQGTELWIEGAIENQYQDGTLGDRWFDSRAYTFICPVTDPACGLKLRMAEYWLAEEGCKATEYQTWQYYDAATSAWVEIDTVTTGEVAAYHDYTETDLAEKRADGSIVSGFRYDCACGSYAIDKTIEFAEGTMKKEYYAVNTIAGVDRKAYSCVSTYDLIHEGYRYITETVHEDTSWDNSSSWTKYAYTYDFENGCIRTENRTDSNGNIDTYQQSAHNTTYSSQTLWDSTCTQFGAWEWKDTCQVCGLVTDSGQEKRQPTAHNWGWYGDQGTFICSTCGLENVNGASGDIVLEDMTEEHGTEDTYVIGYWNRTGRDFVLNMSIVSTSGEILKDLSFQDYTYLNAEENGVNAVSFSISAAKATAEAEGYTSGYGLRITFVPTTSDSDQDCAITFDVQ